VDVTFSTASQAVRLAFHISEVPAYADKFAERNGITALIPLLSRNVKEVGRPRFLW
jgi:hypothetical protein